MKILSLFKKKRVLDIVENPELIKNVHYWDRDLPKKGCYNCHFRRINNEHDFFHECHFNAPIVDNNCKQFGNTSGWPLVRIYFWCGQWKKQNIK